ncbi:hypothetical protein CesoFtcFv8_010211 [Champsocephalus esox]|uniref:LisH domain-containing protein n=1 Tax=Champsocephalus esox TaxID=159716 RepID=A0AAN8C719_9TELE|nr:hypothetical protein CesoFtcFv8_010211 [Champsocephalus esox]
MSVVEASRRELTLLIYRHLKEHGFHSAAEELQKYSPQVETQVTESLWDIYRSWLSNEQQESAKLSKEERNKAATKKKKDKLAIKEETEKKKTVPAKRKRNESKSGENVIKAKKSKTQTKSQAVAGDDSDSDDSLDVDKWKKLLQQMTDSDIAKMDTINALDSAALPPVQKKVRKSRVKPPAKTPNEQNTVGKNKTMEEKAITETPTKKSKPKKSTSKKKAPVISSAAPSQEGNLNAVEDRAATPTLTSSKQDEIKDVTMIEEKTDETPSEPKKKKKKKISEDNVKENTNDTGVEGKYGKKKKKTGVTKGTQGDSIAEEIIAKDKSVDNVDTLEPRIKNKKKKKC